MTFRARFLLDKERPRHPDGSAASGSVIPTAVADPWLRDLSFLRWKSFDSVGPVLSYRAAPLTSQFRYVTDSLLCFASTDVFRPALLVFMTTNEAPCPGGRLVLSLLSSAPGQLDLSAQTKRAFIFIRGGRRVNVGAVFISRHGVTIHGSLHTEGTRPPPLYPFNNTGQVY